MKKLDLGQSVGLLANLGVIAGIVFLGIELRQNNEMLDLQVRMNRQAVQRQSLSRLVDNQAVAGAAVRAQQGEALTALDRYLLHNENVLTLRSYAIIFSDVNEGILDESTIPLAGWRSRYQRFPLIAETWAATKQQHSPEFVQFMEENITNAR